jgi:WD40 repeat protein
VPDNSVLALYPAHPVPMRTNGTDPAGAVMRQAVVLTLTFWLLAISVQAPGHQLPGGTIAVSPSGRLLLSGGPDGCVLMYDSDLRPMGRQQQQQQQQQHGGCAHGMSAKGVSAMCFDASGSSYLTAGGDGSIFVWKASGGLLPRRACVSPAGAGSSAAACCSPLICLRLWISCFF